MKYQCAFFFPLFETGSHVAQSGLKSLCSEDVIELILLPATLGLQACAVTPNLCDTGEQTQGFLPTKQALCQWRYIGSPKACIEQLFEYQRMATEESRQVLRYHSVMTAKEWRHTAI